MNAGRELDALVAEQVMGFSLAVRTYVWDIPAGYVSSDSSDDHNIRCISETATCGYLPAYSTDIGAAWEVVEKLWAEFSWTLTDDVPSTVVARFWQGDHEWEAVGQSAPHAICLAALKAVA